MKLFRVIFLGLFIFAMPTYFANSSVPEKAFSNPEKMLGATDKALVSVEKVLNDTEKSTNNSDKVSSGSDEFLDTSRDESWVKRFVYKKDAVYPLTFYSGYVVRIDFSPEDQIREIILGNNTGWNMQTIDNMLFIKTIVSGVETNMTVLTKNRIYEFLISSAVLDGEDVSPRDAVYKVVFTNTTDKSDDKDAKDDGVDHGFNSKDSKKKEKDSKSRFTKENIMRQTLKTINDGNLSSVVDMSNIYFEYAFVGSDDIAPQEVFDDSFMTYVLVNDELPIVLIPDGLATYKKVSPLILGKYYVFHGVYPQFRIVVGDKYVDVVRVSGEEKVQ